MLDNLGFNFKKVNIGKYKITSLMKSVWSINTAIFKILQHFYCQIVFLPADPASKSIIFLFL